MSHEAEREKRSKQTKEVSQTGVHQMAQGFL